MYKVHRIPSAKIGSVHGIYLYHLRLKVDKKTTTKFTKITSRLGLLSPHTEINA